MKKLLSLIDNVELKGAIYTDTDGEEWNYSQNVEKYIGTMKKQGDSETKLKIDFGTTQYSNTIKEMGYFCSCVVSKNKEENENDFKMRCLEIKAKLCIALQIPCFNMWRTNPDDKSKIIISLKTKDRAFENPETRKLEIVDKKELSKIEKMKLYMTTQYTYKDKTGKTAKRVCLGNQIERANLKARAIKDLEEEKQKKLREEAKVAKPLPPLPKLPLPPLPKLPLPPLPKLPLPPLPKLPLPPLPKLPLPKMPPLPKLPPLPERPLPKIPKHKIQNSKKLKAIYRSFL
jgi:hypothetical protein